MRRTAPASSAARSTTSTWSTRDGGINGVKLTWEECETEYNASRGVECYERLKSKNGGAIAGRAAVHRHRLRHSRPRRHDKIPLTTLGYGRSDAANGKVFPWSSR